MCLPFQSSNFNICPAAGLSLLLSSRLHVVSRRGVDSLPSAFSHTPVIFIRYVGLIWRYPRCPDSNRGRSCSPLPILWALTGCRQGVLVCFLGQFYPARNLRVILCWCACNCEDDFCCRTIYLLRSLLKTSLSCMSRCQSTHWGFYCSHVDEQHAKQSLGGSRQSLITRYLTLVIAYFTNYLVCTKV